MSDLPDTPMLGRFYCPGCEPEADPTREILDVRYCSDHRPPDGGPDDALGTTSGAWLSGSAEAEGATCRGFATILNPERRTL